MADVAASLRQWLASQSSITALIGSNPCRMYREVLPQNVTLPAVMFRVISTTHIHKLSAGANVPGGLAGLARRRVQFNAIAMTSASANAIAEAIKDSGIMTLRGTVNGVYIKTVELESGQTTFVDSEDPGTSDSRFVVSQDFMVHYAETGS